MGRLTKPYAITCTLATWTWGLATTMSTWLGIVGRRAEIFAWPIQKGSII